MIGSSMSLLDDRVVPANDVFVKIKAGQSAEFDNRIIVGDLNLSALRIERPIHFDHTIFQNSVNFDSTTFNGYADFTGSIFNSTADFESSIFNKPANFDNTRFNGPANFYNASFNGATAFDACNFNGSASFGLSKFNGLYADFRASNFNASANFEFSKLNHAFFGSFLVSTERLVSHLQSSMDLPTSGSLTSMNLPTSITPVSKKMSISDPLGLTEVPTLNPQHSVKLPTSRA
jgi:hypothetical protein